MKKFLLCLFLLPLAAPCQQVGDTAYMPTIFKTAYMPGKGPVIAIDEGHHNFHTRGERYAPFARLLERDGYKVTSYKGLFEKNKLSQCRILVIANALHEINIENWYLPTPSAFSPKEIEIVKNWVQQGGNLFLIADHMPMAGAAADLAAAFGFRFTNGFALDTSNRGPAFFNLQEGTLVSSPITKGRNENEKLQQVASFTGQVFEIPEEANPVLLLGKNFKNYLPDTAWVFTASTPVHDATGWCQGAVRDYGKGRVAVFGEAAMFTAQLAGPKQIKVGMNAKEAAENYQLLLNIIHWLDRKL